MPHNQDQTIPSADLQATGPIDVLVCVSGSIAAYKSCMLVRELMRQGLQVQVAMTRDAQRFVGPLTFAGLSRRPVLVDDAPEGSGPIYPHLDAARDAKLIIVAPATANTIVKLAHGLADSIVCESCLAASGQLLVAPAMNLRMWAHPATQASVKLLSERGAIIVGPAVGMLAEGEEGEGRMASVQEIAARALSMLAPTVTAPGALDAIVPTKTAPRTARRAPASRSRLDPTDEVFNALVESGYMDEIDHSFDRVIIRLIEQLVRKIDVERALHWLTSPRPEFGGETAVEVIQVGRLAEVEALFARWMAQREAENDKNAAWTKTVEDVPTPTDVAHSSAPNLAQSIAGLVNMACVDLYEEYHFFDGENENEDGSGVRHESVREALGQLVRVMSPADAARWMAIPLPDLRDTNAIDAIYAGHIDEVMQAVARVTGKSESEQALASVADQTPAQTLDQTKRAILTLACLYQAEAVDPGAHAQKALRAQLMELLSQYGGDHEPQQLADWLTQPKTIFCGRTPLAMLEGGDIEAVRAELNDLDADTGRVIPAPVDLLAYEDVLSLNTHAPEAMIEDAMADLARLEGFKLDDLTDWQKQDIYQACLRLSQVIKPEAIAPWLSSPCLAMGNVKPVSVLLNGCDSSRVFGVISRLEDFGAC